LNNIAFELFLDIVECFTKMNHVKWDICHQLSNIFG
jgi:hypothetical protein